MKDRKLELRKSYDETAGTYDSRYEDTQRKKYAAVLKNIPEKIGRVLDVGCGTGLLLGELCERAGQVVGIDASERMLDVAKSRCAGAELVIADADSLPFRSGSFDCVVSVTMIQNMPDPGKTIEEISRVLGPEGLAFLTTLKNKHTAAQLEDWARRSGLGVKICGKIEMGEDVFCVCRKEVGF